MSDQTKKESTQRKDLLWRAGSQIRKCFNITLTGVKYPVNVIFNYLKRIFKWLSLTKWGRVASGVILLAAIVQILGFSLRDFFKKQNIQEPVTHKDTQVSTTSIETHEVQSPVLKDINGDVHINFPSYKGLLNKQDSHSFKIDSFKNQ